MPEQELRCRRTFAHSKVVLNVFISDRGVFLKGPHLFELLTSFNASFRLFSNQLVELRVPHLLQDV
jgi:hypothetical protein